MVDEIVLLINIWSDVDRHEGASFEVGNMRRISCAIDTIEWERVKFRNATIFIQFDSNNLFYFAACKAGIWEVTDQAASKSHK